MKIDLFINLLDGKKKLTKASAKLDLSRYVDGEKLSETPAEADQKPRLRLESLKANAQQRRAYVVRDENLRQLDQLGREGQLYPHPDISSPKSLSAKLNHSSSEFEKSIQQLFENPDLLRDAHQDIDRDVALGLLRK